MSKPPWVHLTTQGIEDAKEKIAKYTDKAEKLQEELKAVDEELEKLRKQVQDIPPPEEFSQEWAQENRALIRLIASKEQERMSLVRAKTTASQNHETFLKRLMLEAERQLKADRVARARAGEKVIYKKKHERAQFYIY